MGILFYLLAQPLNPDNQQSLLRIDDDWLEAFGFSNDTWKDLSVWVDQVWIDEN